MKADKKEIKVELFTIDDGGFLGYDRDSHTMSLEDFIKKIKSKVKEATKLKGIKSHGTTLHFSESYGIDDSCYDSLIVTVNALRWETDEELENRISKSEKIKVTAKKIAKTKRIKKAVKELADYKRLQKKFEGMEV